MRRPRLVPTVQTLDCCPHRFVLQEIEEKLANAMPEGWIERQEAKDEDDEDA